jgi:hypothetical protein
MGRTAAISATATATSKAVSGSMEQNALRAQQEQAAAIQAQREMEQMKSQLAGLQASQSTATLVQPATPVATSQSDLLAQLTQLAQLKEAGALSEAEFQQAKAKLLA